MTGATAWVAGQGCDCTELSTNGKALNGTSGSFTSPNYVGDT